MYTRPVRINATHVPDVPMSLFLQIQINILCRDGNLVTWESDMSSKRSDSTALFEYGIDSDSDLVHVTKAKSGVDYQCPGCTDVLRRIEGDTGRLIHFRHKNESCSYESYEHNAAKKLVAQVINRWILGLGKPPTLLRRQGGRLKSPALVTRWLTKNHMPTQALVERKIAPEDPHSPIADVKLVRGGDVLLAVEIVQTHGVTPEKAKWLAEAEVPWIEVNAEGILYNPYQWRVISHNRVPVNVVGWVVGIGLTGAALWGYNQWRQHQLQNRPWWKKLIKMR